MVRTRAGAFFNGPKPSRQVTTSRVVTPVIRTAYRTRLDGATLQRLGSPCSWARTGTCRIDCVADFTGVLRLKRSGRRPLDCENLEGCWRLTNVIH